MLSKSRVTRRAFLAGAPATAAGGGLALSGCGGEEKESPLATVLKEQGEPKRGGTIRRASTVLLSLDPMTAAGAPLAGLFYSVLVQLTDWQGTVGDLATSWEVIDGLEWVFTLRPGVRFQDIPPASGRTFVAPDVVHSVDREKSMPGASESWDTWVDRYEAPDDATFIARTKNPYAYLLNLVGMCAIIPIEAVEEFGDLTNHAIGTGPFMLGTFSQDTGLEVVRNPLYYHDYPYVDGHSIRVIPDEASIQAAYRANAIDIYVASNRLKADVVRGVPGTSVTRYLDRAYACLRMNAVRAPSLKDERVREAFDLALDRKAMIDRLQFGDGELAGPVPPAFDTALPKEEVEAAYKRDVAKAKQLLSAAGQEGLRLKLSIGNYADFPDQAAMIKDNLAEAGITIDIDVGEVGAWLSNMMLGNFEITVFTHYAYITDEIPLQSHHSHGDTRTDRNYLGVDDPEVDAILDQAQQTIDDEERKKLAWEAQRLVLKRHGPTLHLYQPYGYWCAYDYIKGYTPTSYGFGLFKYDYWIDKG